MQSAKSVLGYLRSEYVLCESRINKNSPLGQPCLFFQLAQCAGACQNIEDTEAYNERALMAGKHITRLFKDDFFIMVSGRSIEETGLILIEDGIFKGYGYLPISDTYYGAEEMKEAIQYRKPNHEVNGLIFQYLETKIDYKIIKL